MQEGLRPGGVRGAFIQGAVRGASPTAVKIVFFQMDILVLYILEATSNMKP